ncbi:hypothetical protein QE152_g6299 [Popillia japonica]|uniref:Uncharacterized protein n=1 Tax=Popillia japonica TaxID=7064 RepID=A0AAW1MHJ2_POPJA
MNVSDRGRRILGLDSPTPAETESLFQRLGQRAPHTWTRFTYTCRNGIPIPYSADNVALWSSRCQYAKRRGNGNKSDRYGDLMLPTIAFASYGKDVGTFEVMYWSVIINCKHWEHNW